MPLLIPDLNRQTPASIPAASDLCRKWTLWHRGDHIDSLICCKLFPYKHSLTNANIARALANLHKPCAGMTGRDVADLFAFLTSHPDHHTNGIRLWQGIKEKNEKDSGGKAGTTLLDVDDESKVMLAIGRFGGCRPVLGTRKRRRSRKAREEEGDEDYY